jgi:hypothetical protein
MLRRAWRIVFRRDSSEVALRRGTPLPDAERFVSQPGVAKLVTGGVTVATTLLVVVVAVPYATWSAIAGSMIRTRFCADFSVSRYARKPVGKGAAP